MRSLDILVGAWIGGLAFATAAHAADMSRSVPTLPPPDFRYATPPAIELASGWYLRGDLGGRFHSVKGVAAAAGFTDPADNTLGAGFWGGIGAGYKTTGPLRIDATLDFGTPVSYSGTTVTPGDATAKVSSLIALFNAYYDIGTWSGFTPYIGVGIGVAYMRTSDYQSAVTPPLTPVAAFGRWDFAWGAMAGASYRLSRSFLVDAGYRYLGLGDAETASGSSGKLAIRNITAHEFRIGLRWMLDVPLR